LQIRASYDWLLLLLLLSAFASLRENFISFYQLSPPQLAIPSDLYLVHSDKNMRWLNSRRYGKN
jgi:hypothetical protein